MSKEKVDTTTNGSRLQQSVKLQRERECNLKPLRIDSRTVILTKKSNCNDKYAEEYKEKISKSPGIKGTALGGL